ncbi:hypothetical protein [Tichowtungia aerotolerans]|uniref:Uncharacterized protein n=1 Tax=Tichowtungia aerotolerans TaxID=2697043 RepID=A0A6P1MGB7_9BACT|nr:hypothetical protein [Tichowtungia aerotolerans]QHI70125.1 hypothetical protein GT409_11950 [Tichowtungia aerotolerans]
MLHDPSHYTPAVSAEEIVVSSADKDVLRRLAEQKAEISSLPVQQETTRLWTAPNDMVPERPMVWANEICWNEMEHNEELTLQCEGGWAREQERVLRHEIYQWNHLPGDIVVSTRGSNAQRRFTAPILELLSRPISAL